MKPFSIFLLIVSFISPSFYIAPVQADELTLPPMPNPGTMVNVSPQFNPAELKGITIHPNDPFMFDFIIQRGDKVLSNGQKQDEYKRLVKYFLASLAVPDEDQWVNLSPYEKERIIKDDFGKTLMGRDLLAQDYILKQITASLIYPEDRLGKTFWDTIYTKAQKEYGTTNIPVNTFNKVWIIPDDALIYEKGNTAYVLKNHLKVMLEEDYIALEKHTGITTIPDPDIAKNKINALGSQVVRQLVLPALEREVNTAQNFALLRQVYSGMLLAAWYKRTLKASILGQLYADKSKVKGVDQDPKTNEAIYQRYLRAYKKGVFNYIKDDMDQYTHQPIPRKYFSGGETGYSQVLDMAQLGHDAITRIKNLSFDQSRTVAGEISDADDAQVSLVRQDAAMLNGESAEQQGKVAVLKSKLIKLKSGGWKTPTGGIIESSGVMDQIGVLKHRISLGTIDTNKKGEHFLRLEYQGDFVEDRLFIMLLIADEGKFNIKHIIMGDEFFGTSRLNMQSWGIELPNSDGDQLKELQIDLLQWLDAFEIVVNNGDAAMRGHLPDRKVFLADIKTFALERLKEIHKERNDSSADYDTVFEYVEFAMNYPAAS